MNNLMIRLLAMLDRIKSKIRIQQDIKQLEKTLSMKLNASLNKNNSRANISRDIKQISAGQEIKVKARVDRKSLQSSLNSARQQVENSSRSQPVNITSRVNVNADSLNQANQAQNELIDGGGRIRNVVQYYVNWQKVLDLIVQSARKAVDTSVELAKAQTDLQIASGKTNSEMQSMMRNYNQLAYDMSSTTLDIVSAADDWIRQGKSISETNQLIQDSIVLAKIGQLNTAQATEYLTSTLNGYALEAKDAVSINDKLSAVDLSAAVTVGDLAESLAKTSNSARLAGVDIDTLIGYIATIKTVSKQSASVVGTSIKSMLARYGKVSIGDYIDSDGTDFSGEISQLEKILGKFDIKLRDTVDEFRNFDDIIADIAKIWSGLSSVDRNLIATGLGGSHQREPAIVLLNNYSKAMELAEVSANSAGTAMQKFNVYTQGIEAAGNRLVSTFESLAFNVVNSEFLEKLAEAAASIIGIIDKFKLVQTALTALTFTGIIKGLLLFGTKMVAVKNNMNAMTTAMNLSTKATQRNRAENILLSQSYASLTPKQQRLLLSNKKLNMEQKIAILRASGLTRAQAKAKLQAMGLTAATNTAANATFSLRAAWETLKLSIASNPIGLIVTVLTSATMIISTAIEKQKELEEAAKAAAEEARNEANEIKDLYSEYFKLSKEIQTDASRKDELSTVTDNLLKKLGYEKSAIKDLTKEYGDLDTAIKSVTLEGLQDKWDELLVDYGIKEKALTDLLPRKPLIGGTRVLNAPNDKGLNDYEDTIQLLEKSGLFDEILRPSASETGIISDITFYLPDGLEGVEGVKRYYDIISKAIQTLNQEYSSEELIDNAVYQKFVSIQTAMRTKMDEYGVSVNSVNENLATQQILTSEITNGVPETVEQFDKFRESLIKSASSNNQFVGTEEDVENAIDNSLRSMPEFAEFFETDLPEAIDKSDPALDKVSKKISTLSEKMKEVIGIADEFANAIKKVIGGESLSLDEVQKLLEIDPTLVYSVKPTTDGGYTIDQSALQNAARKYNEGSDTETGEAHNPYKTEYENSQQKVADLEQQLADLQSKSSDPRIASDGVNQAISDVKKQLAEAEDELAANELLYSGYQRLIDSAVNTAKTEDIENDLKEITDETNSKVGDYNTSIKNLSNAIDNMNSNVPLTYDEMTSLVEDFPTLNGMIKEGTDGFYIEVEALKTLRDETYTTRNQFIEDEKAKTQTAITEAQNRIKVWEILINISKKYGESYEGEIETLQGYIDSASVNLTSLVNYLVQLDSMNKNVYDSSKSSSSKDTISEELQNQIDYYDKIIQGIEAVADKRIEAIDKEIEAVDKEVDALEKEKDALKEQNDEKQRELDLIEAKNNLDKAKKQKVFVYKEGEGLVQVQDEKAVKDAQKEYDDAQREIKEAEIDKKIDSWNERKESLEDSKEAAEEYKNTFSDMKSDIEGAIATETAKVALGTDEKGLLNLSPETTDNLRNGLAEAVVEKDKHDNKDNPYYKNITLADFLKSLGSNATPEEFKAAFQPALNYAQPTLAYDVQGKTNYQYVTNNNGTTNFTANFNISEATNPDKVASVVRTEITDLLQKYYNKKK